MLQKVSMGGGQVHSMTFGMFTEIGMSIFSVVPKCSDVAKKIIKCSFPLQSAVAINTRRYIKDRKDCIGREGDTSPYCQSGITTKGIGGTPRGSIQRMTIRLQLVSIQCLYHACSCSMFLSVQCLYNVCTMRVPVQCVCLYNVCTMLVSVQCLYNVATNACVCTMLVCVWPQISGFTDHQM